MVPQDFSTLQFSRGLHISPLFRSPGSPSAPAPSEVSQHHSLTSALVPSPVEGHVDPLFAREAQHPADHVAVMGAPSFVTHLRPAVRKPDFDQSLSHGQGPPAPPNGWSNSYLLHLQVMLYLGMGPQVEEGIPMTPFICPATLKEP